MASRNGVRSVTLSEVVDQARHGDGELAAVDVVRYRCKSDQADKNQRVVENVFSALNDSDPGGVRYVTFRLEDDAFVHIADVDGNNPLLNLDAFAAFQTRRPRPLP